MLLFSLTPSDHGVLTADSDDHSCEKHHSSPESVEDQRRSSFMEELGGSLQFIPPTYELDPFDMVIESYLS